MPGEEEFIKLQTQLIKNRGLDINENEIIDIGNKDSENIQKSVKKEKKNKKYY